MRQPLCVHNRASAFVEHGSWAIWYDRANLTRLFGSNGAASRRSCAAQSILVAVSLLKSAWSTFHRCTESPDNPVDLPERFQSGEILDPLLPLEREGRGA